MNSLWMKVPYLYRSTVRSYINGEQDADRVRAMELCEQYGLDYQEMRAVVLAEMVEESRALDKSWTPAAGSRPPSIAPVAGGTK